MFKYIYNLKHMSDYKNYQLRQLGLTAQSLQAKKQPVREMTNPSAANGVIALGVRGSSTGGLPSGVDQTGIPSETPTGRLGGYEPIPTAKDNSEIIDKTPANPQINSASPITDNPATSQTPHAHQIQQAKDQAPQTVTGASTDSDSTLTLKSAMPKDSPTIDIDVSEEEKDPNDMDGEESMADEDKAKSGLQEGKHKSGCKCGFCANKGSFKKKIKSAADNVKASFGKEDDEDESKKDDEDLIVDKDEKKSKVDETFGRHMVFMKEYLGVNESKESEKVEADQEDIAKFKMDKEKAGMVKLSEAFEKMRGLANLGERKVLSNGLWESTQVNEKDSGKWMQDVSKNAEKNGTKGALHKDMGVAEKDKIPTERLKSVQARLHAKAERGELTDKELEVSRRINAALNMRKESMDETFNRHKNLALGKK